MVHAGVYMGNNQLCHCYCFDDGGVTRGRIGNVSKDEFLRFIENWEEDKKIIAYEYNGNISDWKNIDEVNSHLDYLLFQENRYFNELFGEFNIDTNNCEHFVNRCVLSLSFSEHVDWKERRENRIFGIEDFNLINQRLNELASEQLEAQIEQLSIRGINNDK